MVFYNLATQQIIEIARAVQRDARILLLDEPTSAIGSREIDRLFRVIRSLRERGVGIVYVSHKLDEVFSIADRITILKDGKYVNTVNTKETTPDEVVHMMVGREFDKLFPERDNVKGKPIIEIRGLSGDGFSDINLTIYSA